MAAPASRGGGRCCAVLCSAVAAAASSGQYCAQQWRQQQAVSPQQAGLAQRPQAVRSAAVGSKQFARSGGGSHRRCCAQPWLQSQALLGAPVPSAATSCAEAAASRPVCSSGGKWPHAAPCAAVPAISRYRYCQQRPCMICSRVGGRCCSQLPAQCIPVAGMLALPSAAWAQQHRGCMLPVGCICSAARQQQLCWHVTPQQVCRAG